MIIWYPSLLKNLALWVKSLAAFIKIKFIHLCFKVDECTTEPAQCAVGVSLSLDRLASLVTQEEMMTKYASTDVIICSQVGQIRNPNRPIEVLIFHIAIWFKVHHESLVRKKLELAKNFWMLGIRCYVSDIHMSVDDVVEVGLECGSSYVVILHDSDAPAKLKIMTDKVKRCPLCFILQTKIPIF